jgi:SAM-dependent methyltransferase
MKTIVTEKDLVASEIKPDSLLRDYLDLVNADLEGFFEGCEWTERPCPGCGTIQGILAFEKRGFSYRDCPTCGSLYASPVPPTEDLVRFYRSSSSSIFWREAIETATRDVRLQKLGFPRARWVLENLGRYRPGGRRLLIGGFHSSLLVQALLDLRNDLSIVIEGPLADLEELAGEPRNEVEIVTSDRLEIRMEGAADTDAVLLFDLLDRCVDLEKVFKNAFHTLAPGGLLLIATLLGSGIDQQILREDSSSIYPPERISLLSVEGLERLVESAGFEVLEFSTPGVLDVDALKEFARNGETSSMPRFIQYLMTRRDGDAHEALQEYVQRFRLSSFGRLALRKRGA